MDVLIKCAALAIFSALTGLMIKRYNPELSFALSTATVTVLLLSGSILAEKVIVSVKETALLFGSADTQLRPVFKCLGIAAASRFGADLCRDASQSALGTAVETLGSLCAAVVAMPTILSVLTMIGGML